MKTTKAIETKPWSFLKALLAWVLLLGSLGVNSVSGADNNDALIAELRALRQRVEQLERQLIALQAGGSTCGPVDPRLKQAAPTSPQAPSSSETNRQTEAQAAQTKPKEAPKVSIGEKGFAFSSGDGNFGLQLKGVLQVDSRSFFEDSISGNDGFLLRRARPILQGTLFRDFEFLFIPDFGGGGSPQIFDAYLNYRYSPALQFQAGKFKVPVGLEQLQADRDILFNERALPTDLVPNRDLGFELHGDLFEGVVSYAAGIFNGIGDARNSNNADFEDSKAFAGRLFFQPFRKGTLEAARGLGFGVGGSYGDMEKTNTAGLPNNNGFATVGQQVFFAYNPATRSVVADGAHWRLSPQASYYYGPFGLLGEYVISDQQVSLAGAGPRHSTALQHTAWQVAGSWVLTGEDASFTGVIPRRPFNPREGTWGAVQLALRYSRLDVDEKAFPLYSNPQTSARSAREWSVGLNWYLNRNLRLATSFSHTEFEGGGGAGANAPAAVTRNDENVLFTRIQLAF